MAFPFENDTAKVVKRLSLRSLQADKRRNIFVILTIALAVCLMSLGAFTYTAGNVKTVEQIRGQYQSGCINLSIQEINRLVDAGEFEKWGYETPSDTVRYKDANVSIKFVDPGMRDLLRIGPITGEYPLQENEICLERGFLKYFSIPEEIGQQITLNIGYGEQAYTLTGILEKVNNSRLFEGYISEAAVLSSIGENSFTIRFRFLGSNIKQPEQLRSSIEAFYQEMGISEDDTFYSSTYFDLSDLYLGSDIQIYLLALLIAIACAIVIYSIFYISVMGKMREYGHLKVIGATPKQLKQVVKRERRILTLAGIPIGLIIGAALCVILMPGYWDWENNLKYAVIISMITYFIVLISTKKPLKMVAKVSAIEATKSTGYSNNGPAISRRLHHRLSVWNLARMNFSRNKKKSAMTFLSLGLTGIMAICVAAYANSIDAEEMARSSFGDQSDYLLSTEIASPELLTIQENNPLGEGFRNQLAALEDVEHITYYAAMAATIEQIPLKDEVFLIDGFTRDQMRNLLPATAVQEGNADYDNLLKNDGILLVRTSENLLSKLYHTDFQIGDPVTLNCFNEQSKTYTVMGIVDNVQVVSSTHFFILPEEELHTQYPEIKDFTMFINVHGTEAAKEDSRRLRQNLFETMADPNVTISSVEDYAILLNESLQKQSVLFYGLVIFIALFALLNLINTLMTSFLSRKQEFGILQSVGLSNRQLSKMLSYECLFYIVITIMITLTIGTVASIGICSIFNQLGIFGTIHYHFPVVQMLIFLAVLFLIQVIFSAIAGQYPKKLSLVERIKAM